MEGALSKVILAVGDPVADSGVNISLDPEDAGVGVIWKTDDVGTLKAVSDIF
jgi:hypothetical protein